MPRRGSTVGSTTPALFEQYSAQAAREAELANYYAQKAQESASQAEQYQGSAASAASDTQYDANGLFSSRSVPPGEAVATMFSDPINFAMKAFENPIGHKLLGVVDKIFTGTIDMGREDPDSIKTKADRLLKMSAGLHNVSLQILRTQEKPTKENVPFWFIRGIVGEMVASGVGAERMVEAQKKLQVALGVDPGVKPNRE